MTTRTKRRKFLTGEEVRDRANLGGIVVETWGNGVRVNWNNGEVCWIDERFLSLLGEPLSVETESRARAP